MLVAGVIGDGVVWSADTAPSAQPSPGQICTFQVDQSYQARKSVVSTSL